MERCELFSDSLDQNCKNTTLRRECYARFIMTFSILFGEKKRKKTTHAGTAAKTLSLLAIFRGKDSGK